MAKVARNRLDRRARLAVTAAVVALLAGPLLYIGSRALAADEPIVVSSPQDDQLVLVGSHTMLLEKGSLGRRIADWLRLERADSRSFDVGDQIFAPSSADLTSEGAAQLTRFVQLMKAHPALYAGIVVTGRTKDAAALQLEAMRARTLRNEMVSDGISPARISASEQAAGGEATSVGAPHLVVLLSRGRSPTTASSKVALSGGARLVAAADDDLEGLIFSNIGPNLLPPSRSRRADNSQRIVVGTNDCGMITSVRDARSLIRHSSLSEDLEEFDEDDPSLEAMLLIGRWFSAHPEIAPIADGVDKWCGDEWFAGDDEQITIA